MLRVYAANPFVWRLISLICAPIFPSQLFVFVVAENVNAGSVILYVIRVIVYVIAVMIIVMANVCCRRNFSAFVNFSGRRGSLFVMILIY